MVTDKQPGIDLSNNIYVLLFFLITIGAGTVYCIRKGEENSKLEANVTKRKGIAYERITIKLWFIDGTTDTLVDLKVYKSAFFDDSEFKLKEGTFSYMKLVEYGGHWENIASYVKKYDILERESNNEQVPSAVH